METKWILCEKEMPPEHNSIFAKLKETPLWLSNKMFEKNSDYVIVSIENKDKTKMTSVARTLDGKWHCDYARSDYKVIAWMPLPDPV